MSDLKEIAENARQEMIAAGVDGWPNVVLWQQERIEELERRWDDLPWEEIEGLFYPNAREVRAWSREAAEIFRKILALREREEG